MDGCRVSDVAHGLANYFLKLGDFVGEDEVVLFLDLDLFVEMDLVLGTELGDIFRERVIVVDLVELVLEGAGRFLFLGSFRGVLGSSFGCFYCCF